MQDTPSVISIDPRGARELDDAIHVTRRDGGWVVHVLLPDVPMALLPGSSEDDAARQAGMTSYSGDSVRRPMLPPAMVEALSLSPNRNGPGILVAIDVTPDLVPSVSGIFRLVTRTAARLSYEQADLAITDTGHPLHGHLASMWDLARRLHADRAAGTGARFDIGEHVFTNEEGQTVRLDDRSAHRSNMAVMEIMILANSALARHAANVRAPILFRNHHLQGLSRGDRASAAAQIALAEGIGRREAAIRLRAMSHLIGQAELGTKPTGHHGLDLDAYAWFTSPLRRYCDVVNLRALLDGRADGGLADLASRLTGLHRSQKEASSDHHAAMSRRRIMVMFEYGRHAALDALDVHTIIRALDENTRYDRAEVVRYLGARMAANGLSGRDMAAIEDRAGDLLGADVAESVTQWLDAEPGRRMLVDEYRGEAPASAMSATEAAAKSDLYELADRRRARVAFADAERIGPPHAPIFVSRAAWTAGGSTTEAQGRGRTKRLAEHAAAAALLAKIAPDVAPSAHEPIPPSPISAAKAPPKAAGQEKAPKTELLEIALARHAHVDFAEIAREGPPHAPTFRAEVTWTQGVTTVRKTGSATSKKDAERLACQAVLAAIAAG